MAHIDKTYHALLETILKDGFLYDDPNRKGIQRLQIPDYKFEHNFDNGFPLLSTKKMYTKGIVAELLWILNGDTNIKYLIDNGCNIWNKDAYNFFKRSKFYSTGNDLSYESFMKAVPYANHHAGKVGRNYGAQLRDWSQLDLFEPGTEGVIADMYFKGKLDQLSWLINSLRTNPMATKKTVTFWNPAESEETALTPCHWSFECLVEPIRCSSNFCYERQGCQDNVCKDSPKYSLTIKWHQHSVDTFLGLPFNIAFYATLTHILAKMCNMVPKGIIGDLSNVHIYEPHLDAVKEQLKNDVNKYGNCKLKMNNGILFDSYNIEGNINNLLNAFKIDQFKLEDYKSYPRIAAEMLAYNK